MKQNQLTTEEAKNYLRIGFNIRLNKWPDDSYIYANQDFSVYNKNEEKLSSNFEEYIDKYRLHEGQYWELYKEPDILRKVWNEYNPIEKQEQKTYDGLYSSIKPMGKEEPDIYNDNFLIRLEFSDKQRLFHFADLTDKSIKKGWKKLNIMNSDDVLAFTSFIDRKYVQGRITGEIPELEIVELELRLFLKLKSYRRKYKSHQAIYSSVC